MAIVAAAIDSANKLGLRMSDLEAFHNPNGEGDIVFVPRNHFRGAGRKIAWLVLDTHGYALNASAKAVTPDLLWPREAKLETWKRTGLSAFKENDVLLGLWLDIRLTVP